MACGHDLRFAPIERGQNPALTKTQIKNPALGGAFYLVAGVRFEPTIFRL